jgi:DNA repair exonuclease SbcCD nuclease subunit
VIAGDLYDGDWRDAATGMFFSSRMSRLRERGIRVFLVRGNHDAASQITRSLHLPENVHVFDGARASTARIDKLHVAIHGQSYAGQHVHANLAAGYPAAVPGWFNLGLLHTSLGGDAEHEVYAPCSLDDLRAKEYDYWALGHIHHGGILQSAPHVVYAGNPQGRSIRETGPKGCYVVSVDDGQRVAACEFAELDVLRWRNLEIDLGGTTSLGEANERIDEALRACAGEESRGQLVRVTLAGATAAHAALMEGADWKDDLRARATDLGRESLWIEKIVVRTTAPAGLAPLSLPLSEALIPAAPFQALLGKLPAELSQEVAGWLDAADPRHQQMRAEARALLEARLAATEGGHAN